VNQPAQLHSEGNIMAMQTMRTCVLHGVGRLEIETRPIPAPGPDEVLVRVTAVGVCGSDVHYFEHGRIGKFVVSEPLILGHEAGGYVAAAGENVSTVSEGDRVSIEPGVPCRDCAQCLAGRYNLCQAIKFFATPPHDGAFAQYVVMPASFVYPVPDQLDDDEAALIEPLSVGVNACKRANVTAGDRVLVTGAGPIGVLAAQVAVAHGAVDVVVTDVNPARLEFAAGLGLTTRAADTYADGEFAADVLLECSGHPGATRDAICALAPGGRAVLVGMGGDDVALPLSAMQENEITVSGAFRYANTWPTAIRLVAAGRVSLRPLVTGHFGLDRVEEALMAGKKHPRSVKAVVNP
jgi:L-iditol 2-dehydrogenase